MKNGIVRIIALLLVSLFVLTSCGAPTDSNLTEGTDSEKIPADTNGEIYIERESKEIKNILNTPFINIETHRIGNYFISVSYY